MFYNYSLLRLLLRHSKFILLNTGLFEMIHNTLEIEIGLYVLFYLIEQHSNLLLHT